MYGNKPWLKITLDTLADGTAVILPAQGRRKARTTPGQWLVFDKAAEDPREWSAMVKRRPLFHANTFEECCTWIDVNRHAVEPFTPGAAPK